MTERALSSGGERIAPDPTRRQPVTRREVGEGVLRFLLDRSSESAERLEPTQDFLVVEHSPTKLCFAVTDGVGSSFLGDLAARFLAERVVDWLFALDKLPGEDRLAAELTQLMHTLVPAADEMAERSPLPPELPPVMRDVLSRQRAYGSEAMVACGRIEWPRDAKARVGVAWLGDGHVRVLLRGDEQQDLTGRTADRWSTKRGPRGKVETRVWSADEVTRVIASTDGAVPELDAAVRLSDSELEKVLEALSKHANSDDIALVDVALTAAAMPPAAPIGGVRLTAEPERASNEGAPSATPAVPADDEPDAERPEAPQWIGTENGRLRWRAVPEADSYCVHASTDPAFGEPLVWVVHEERFDVPPLAGRVWVRVRANVGGRAGAWSEIIQAHEGPSLRRTTFEPASTSARTETPARPELRGDDERPEAPTGFHLVYHGGAMVELVWNAVRGSRGYRVEIDDWRGPPREDRLPGTCVALHLRPGRAYRFRVRADSQGAPWSNALEISIPRR